MAINFDNNLMALKTNENIWIDKKYWSQSSAQIYITLFQKIEKKLGNIISEVSLEKINFKNYRHRLSTVSKVQ